MTGPGRRRAPGEDINVGAIFRLAPGLIEPSRGVEGTVELIVEADGDAQPERHYRLTAARGRIDISEGDSDADGRRRRARQQGGVGARAGAWRLVGRAVVRGQSRAGRRDPGGLHRRGFAAGCCLTTNVNCALREGRGGAFLPNSARGVGNWGLAHLCGALLPANPLSGAELGRNRTPQPSQPPSMPGLKFSPSLVVGAGGETCENALGGQAVMFLEVAPLHERPRRAGARPPALDDGLAAADLARLVEQVLERCAEHRPARRPALKASDRIHDASTIARRGGECNVACRQDDKFVARSRYFVKIPAILRCPGWDSNPHAPYGTIAFKAMASDQFRHPGAGSSYFVPKLQNPVRMAGRGRILVACTRCGPTKPRSSCARSAWMRHG